MRWLVVLLLVLSFTGGCRRHQRPSFAEPQWEKIPGRSDYYCSRLVEPSPVYRAKPPAHWKRSPLLASEETIDTTLPICEYTVADEEGAIRITIHNFPSNSLEERVPPAAQVMRWQQQFDSIRPTDLLVTQSSHSGYSGIYFEGAGIQCEQHVKVLGWSMQLGAEHYRTLLRENSPLARQRRADFTIKAVGPEELMQKYQDEIQAFAMSFELLQPLTTPA